MHGRYVIGGRTNLLERARMALADLRGRGVYSEEADESRSIFVHIPKTGGSSVAYSLFGRSFGHVPYFEYLRANPRKFRRYLKFAFVRNPWDRLVSTYFFLKRGGMNERDRRWADENLAAFPDFAAFVSGWLTEKNVWSWIHFLPQHYFICDEGGAIQMDIVGRFETLNQDFTRIAQRFDRVATLPVVNRSEHRDFRSYYDQRLLGIVERVYQTDIDLFGYYF